MDIFKKKTRKGLVIRYVFDDVEEYNNIVDLLTSLCDEMPENNREDIENLSKLFKDYYEPSSEYADGKPTVTVFEEHFLTLAVLVGDILPIYSMMLNRVISAKKEHLKEIENHIETKRKYLNEIEDHTKDNMEQIKLLKLITK